jgi:SM-20-related protein
MLISETDPLSAAINAIALNGYAIIENFLTPADIDALAGIVKEKWLNGNMVSAKTGKTGLKNQNIRGDYIAWLESQDQHPAIDSYMRQMELLRIMLNLQLFLNVQELETHVALYPVGGAYQKHLDQFNHGDVNQIQHRQLSAILYLNQNWQENHGGALRLHINEQESIDILPNTGRMVLFLSARFWHEVLPAQRERLSITGWFRTRSHSII